MNQEILNRIDALAAKLGLVGAHLWEVLIRQVYVNAGMSVVGLGILAVLTWAYFAKLIPWVQAGGKWSDRDLAAILSGIALTILAVVLVVYFVGSMGCLANPEYCALQNVLSRVD